jgi:hypothetical protein
MLANMTLAQVVYLAIGSAICCPARLVTVSPDTDGKLRDSSLAQALSQKAGCHRKEHDKLLENVDEYQMHKALTCKSIADNGTQEAECRAEGIFSTS